MKAYQRETVHISSGWSRWELMRDTAKISTHCWQKGVRKKVLVEAVQSTTLSLM